MSKRLKAYQTIMAAAINEGIDRGLIDLDSVEPFDAVEYEFRLPSGIRCDARITGDRFGEIYLNEVVVNPDRLVRRGAVVTPGGELSGMPYPGEMSYVPEGVYMFRTGMVGSNAVGCCALARGFLERKRGKWLQTYGGVSKDSLRITNAMKAKLCKLDIAPNGYALEGPIM